MRRRSKFASAIAVAALVLLTPLAASWWVETTWEPPGKPADIDGDGLDDEREQQLGTLPGVVDSDGDGIPDGEEFDYWEDRVLSGEGETQTKSNY